MRNRIFGLFILIGVLGGAYLFYWYVYIFNVVHLTFEANRSEYTLELRQTGNSIPYSCEQNQCNIRGLVRDNYDVFAKTEGFKDISLSLFPERGENIYPLIFEKKYELLSVSPDNISEGETIFLDEKNTENSLTIQEKIAAIKEKKDRYHTIKTKMNTYVYKKRGAQLVLFQNKNEIGLFPIGPKSSLDIYEVKNNPDVLILYFGEKKYFFSLISGKLLDLDFQVPIEYIKKADNSREYIFVTAKGSFLYDMSTNTFEYNTLFSDYVFYKNKTYIGIVKKDESEKKHFFHISDKEQQNSIVLYNTETKEKEILLNISEDIVEIGKEYGRVYIVTQKSEKFFLSHLQE
ncbi:MAG: hypothetical protein GY828_01120 [Candidatus Gracilibacteria bacterium]|nr:hypothetical protein [Candidatus Gracilibacteria bacterium]